VVPADRAGQLRRELTEIDAAGVWLEAADQHEDRMTTHTSLATCYFTLLTSQFGAVGAN
jgi:hypothetical protein